VNILVIIDPFEHKQSEELRKMPYMHCDQQEMKCQFLDKRLNELTMMVLMRQTESCDMLVHMVMIDIKLLVVETKTADITADDVERCSVQLMLRDQSKWVRISFSHQSNLICMIFMLTEIRMKLIDVSGM
nr:hypothetical protein [Tanacetum cinerariifolium]